MKGGVSRVAAVVCVSRHRSAYYIHVALVTWHIPPLLEWLHPPEDVRKGTRTNKTTRNRWRVSRKKSKQSSMVVGSGPPALLQRDIIAGKHLDQLSLEENKSYCLIHTR